MATRRNGTSGHDTMYGSSDDDIFLPGAGNDVMHGDLGNDTFLASEGTDYMFGGGGSDTVDYSQISSSYAVNGLQFGVFVNLQEGGGFEVGRPDGDYYTSIENVTGSNFIDNIVGDGSANVIRGLDGHDYIEGLGGSDVLEGGNGIDYLIYAKSNARVSIDLQSGAASGGHATGDVISGFENIEGSRYSDSLFGNKAANVIMGGDGKDVIDARDGNDVIEGGLGNDIMSGGSGADTFVFSLAFELTGTDHITDFDVERDVMRIDYRAGDMPAIRLDVATYNLGGTADVIVRMTTSAGVSAIVLNDLSLGDLDNVMGQIQFNEVA